MKRTHAFILVLALVLAAVPAMAQKVNVDYAHDFDFDSIKTFQYVDTADSNLDNSLMAERVVSMLKKELGEGGLTEVDSNPDILVTYHATTQENRSFNTTSMGYGGYGGHHGGWGGWGGGGMGSSMTRETTFTEGTLIIDAYDPSDKKMIWRGTGTVTVKSKPEKQIKQIDKIFHKIGKKWDKILKGKGK